MVLPLMPLVAYSIYHLLSKFKNPFIKVVLVLLIGVIPLRMDYFILFDFANAPIPKLDLEQFINGWPAGGGVKESVEFFSEKSKEGPIYIATQGTFGLMPASYEISFINNKKITTKGYWPTNETVPEEVIEASKTMPTYFVFYQDCALCEFPGDAPDSWNLKKIATYNKGIGNTSLTIYQVIPE